MADPTLQGQYPKRGLHQVLTIAAKCVDEESNKRPVTCDIVKAIDYLERQKIELHTQSTQNTLGPSTSTSSSVPEAQCVQNLEEVATSSPTPQARSAQGSHRVTSSAPQLQSPQGSLGATSSSKSN